MKMKISAASLKPKLRIVPQLTTLDGIWSRKISQSAKPRNRSNRRSRCAGAAGGMDEYGRYGLKADRDSAGDPRTRRAEIESECAKCPLPKFVIHGRTL